MPNLKAPAIRVATIKAFIKYAGAQYDDATADLISDMADSGSASVNAELPNGTRAATISYVAPVSRPSVVNSIALMAWLAKNDPEAIEDVQIPAHIEQRVRPEFTDALTCHGLHCITPAGEVVDGMTPTTTKSYIAVKSLKTDDIIAAITQGTLDAGAMLGLPAVTA